MDYEILQLYFENKVKQYAVVCCSGLDYRKIEVVISMQGKNNQTQYQL